MNFDPLMMFLSVIIFFIISLSTIKFLFKSRKRSAKSIYKLIDDLEKKYIY